MYVYIDPGVKGVFQNLYLSAALVVDVNVNSHNDLLDSNIRRVEEDFKHKFSLDSLKDFGNIRFYRDFYWRIGIDPTKQRPAAEALIRRVLQGKSIPRINVAVDSINLASILFIVSIAAYDFEKILGKVILRWSRNGEKFIGIGEEEYKVITRQLVLADDEKIVGLYPHRDSELSKITSYTKSILLITCGVPGVSMKNLYDAAKAASNFLEDYCGGRTIWVSEVS